MIASHVHFSITVLNILSSLPILKISRFIPGTFCTLANPKSGKPMLLLSNMNMFRSQKEIGACNILITLLVFTFPVGRIVVPPRAVRRFHECLAQTSANILHCSCHNLLGHKYFIVTPNWLSEHSIPFKVVSLRSNNLIKQCSCFSHNSVVAGFCRDLVCLELILTGFNLRDQC